MSVTNINKLDGASTFYSTIFNDAFDATNETYKKWCYELAVPINSNSKFIELDLIHSFPLPSEWTGSKVVKSIRASKKLLEVKPYEASIGVSRQDYKYSPQLVGEKVNKFVASNNNFIQSLVVTKLVTGNSEVQTDIDNVAFFATTHPLDDGTTQSNYTTSALSRTTYVAAATAMRSYKDRGGQPMTVKPRYLIVGPNNEYVARDIIESKTRIQGITAAGAVDAAASLVAAASIENSVSLDGVEIIVDNFLTGTYANYWFLVGEVGSAKPMCVGIAKAPYPTDDVDEFSTVPEFTFSIEADLAIGFGVWQTCYGGFVAA